MCAALGAGGGCVPLKTRAYWLVTCENDFEVEIKRIKRRYRSSLIAERHTHKLKLNKFYGCTLLLLSFDDPERMGMESNFNKSGLMPDAGSENTFVMKLPWLFILYHTRFH
jgi:hypothetical protein